MTKWWQPGWVSSAVLNIDDSRYEQAKHKHYTGLKKKRDVVTYALKHLIEQKEMGKVLDLKGKIVWEGNLEKMRQAREDKKT